MNKNDELLARGMYTSWMAFGPALHIFFNEACPSEVRPVSVQMKSGLSEEENEILFMALVSHRLDPKREDYVQALYMVVMSAGVELQAALSEVDENGEIFNYERLAIAVETFYDRNIEATVVMVRIGFKGSNLFAELIESREEFLNDSESEEPGNSQPEDFDEIPPDFLDDDMWSNLFGGSGEN